MMGEDGFTSATAREIAFTISVGAGDQVRIDMAQIAAQQLREIGMDVHGGHPRRHGLGRPDGVPDRLGQPV
ncbi:MAG: hypothetical protein V8T01_05360 [Oscillospiraceae bacterium]